MIPIGGRTFDLMNEVIKGVLRQVTKEKIKLECEWGKGQSS